MQVCKRCVLDEKFPGISFDDGGTCNFCRVPKSSIDQNELKAKYEQEFKTLAAERKGKYNYDCLVGFSGGKDSTYTLHLMKNKYGLNILAYSFNNWFQSDAAIRNINTVVQRLNIDHMTISPSYEPFKKLIGLTVSKELYSKKALERASSICITCISLIRYIGFKIALEKKIPFVVLGMTPGQASLKTSLLKTNAEMLIKMQQALFKPLSEHGVDLMKPYTLEKEDFMTDDSLPYSVNPLSFSEYDEEHVFSTVQRLGWVKPQDTDANSTNCLLNAYANDVHIKKYGFNPYAWEIATMVREGILTREDGYKRIYAEQDLQFINMVKNKLDM